MIHASTSAPPRSNRFNKTPPSLNKIFEDAGISHTLSAYFKQLFHIDPNVDGACRQYASIKWSTLCDILTKNKIMDTENGQKLRNANLKAAEAWYEYSGEIP